MSSVWVNLIRALANRLTGIWVGIVALAGVLALGESASSASPSSCPAWSASSWSRREHDPLR